MPKGSFCIEKFEIYGSMKEWCGENWIFGPKQAPKWEVPDLQRGHNHVFAQTKYMDLFVCVIGNFPSQLQRKSSPHMRGVRGVPCFWPYFPIFWVTPYQGPIDSINRGTIGRIKSVYAQGKFLY